MPSADTPEEIDIRITRVAVMRNVSQVDVERSTATTSIGRLLVGFVSIAGSSWTLERGTVAGQFLSVNQSAAVAGEDDRGYRSW